MASSYTITNWEQVFRNGFIEGISFVVAEFWSDKISNFNPSLGSMKFPVRSETGKYFAQQIALTTSENFSTFLCDGKLLIKSMKQKLVNDVSYEDTKTLKVN